MAKVAAKDVFANKFYVSVTQSAADTLTFAELQTNINQLSRVAWILHRLEWFVDENMLQQLVGDAELVKMAITSNDKMSDLALDDPGVIDFQQITTIHYGTAGNALSYKFPITREFDNLPGGGLIVAPRPLFIALDTNGCSAVQTAEVRGYYTQRVLTDAEYFDLIDFYRILV